MDYIGSKSKLNDWIFSFINEIVPKKSILIDGCSGSGAVSRYAVEQGYNVISNDIMLFPKSIINGSIGLSEKQKIKLHCKIKKLNNLEGIDGFFYNNFSIDSKYFSKENARKIDAFRIEIEKEKDIKLKDAILYCSIEALSKVSNTAGTHGAYLKSLKDRAKNDIIVNYEKQIDGNVEVYSMNILDLLKIHSGDVLYLDPPYNSRQYPNNYHLYETFVRYDSPELTGKTRIRANWQKEGKSSFCIKKECFSFLKNVIETADVKHIFMSYSSDGLLTKKEICTAFDAIVMERLQKRYKSDNSNNRIYKKEDLFEYVFYIKK